MKIAKNANILLITLISLSTLLAIIYLNQDKNILEYKVGLNYYQHYLSEKLSLANKLNIVNKLDFDKECNHNGYGDVLERKNGRIIHLRFKLFTYHFSCQFSSIFLQKKPETKKYVAIEKNITALLDIPLIQSRKTKIIEVKHLAELPHNSEQEPYIVHIQNAIEGERLEHNFYGIIITEYPFIFTGDQQIQGTVFAPLSQKLSIETNRHIKHNVNVINRLEEIYSKWNYLPHTKNILFNENV